ncbi:MAG: hypothetical protein ACR2P7_05360 [bacterium]
MQTLPITEVKNSIQLMRDPEFRQRVLNKDPDALAFCHVPVSAEGDSEQPEIKVVVSTKNKMYLPLMRIDSQSETLGNEQLAQIQAAGQTAGTASTIGSLGCFSTFGSAPLTVSTYGSMSTLGSTGTAGSGN